MTARKCGSCGTTEKETRLEDGTGYVYLRAGKNNSFNGVKIIPSVQCAPCRRQAKRVIEGAARTGWLKV